MNTPSKPLRRWVAVQRVKPQLPTYHSDNDVWVATVRYRSRGRMVRAKYKFIPAVELCKPGTRICLNLAWLK